MPPARIITLKKRREFLRLRGGARWAGPAFVLETKPAPADDPDQHNPRFGFTITKAMGNAVVRNRIRRRLRAALGEVAPASARPGHHYVLVARTAAALRPFSDLKKDLEQAFQRVHHAASQKRRGS